MQEWLNLVRWDKPVGTWLLFWPCAWSIVLAAAQTHISLMPMLHLVALFFLGALIMRSAGCIINDLWDKDFDAQVERTKNRPLASGAISIRQALLLLALLLFGALLIVIQLKAAVFWYALLSLPLVIIYPLMKRITWWPQAFLGLTFNFGALMGWVAVTGEIALPAILLYISGIFWTLSYDTIYAFQDITDDSKVGIKSTALYLKGKEKQSIAVFSCLSFAIYFYALVNIGVGMVSYLSSLGALLFIIRQVRTIDSDNPQKCLSQFKTNTFYGFIILMPILIYYYYS